MDIFSRQGRIFLDIKKCGRWDLNKNHCILDNAYFKAFPTLLIAPHNTVLHTFCPFSAPLFIPIIFHSFFFVCPFICPSDDTIFIPVKSILTGILIDILSKNVIIKLSDTVDALYLVFLQLRKTRIEIIIFWLMQKECKDRLFSLSFFLFFRRCMRRRLHLRVLPDLLPEAYQIRPPGSGHSWHQTWTGMTRFCSAF